MRRAGFACCHGVFVVVVWFCFEFQRFLHSPQREQTSPSCISQRIHNEHGRPNSAGYYSDMGVVMCKSGPSLGLQMRTRRLHFAVMHWHRATDPNVTCAATFRHSEAAGRHQCRSGPTGPRQNFDKTSTKLRQNLDKLGTPGNIKVTMD